jgi:hypothetical protein
MSMTIVSGAICSCRHPIDCNHECHGRHCDPTEHICSLDYLPDEGGLSRWGCRDCTPGEALPHMVGCPVAGPVEVPLESPELG